MRTGQRNAIVGDQAPAGAALLGRPADKLIPRLEMQRGRAPGGHGQPPSLVDPSLAQLLAHQSRVVQIMILDNDFVAPVDFLRAGQQRHMRVFQKVLFGWGWFLSFCS